MPFSYYLQRAVVNHVFRNVTYTPASVLHLALFTSGTGLESGTLTNEVAINATTGYTRQLCAWSVPVNGLITNVTDVSFPAALSDWGTITHVAVVDAATAGNILDYITLSPSRTINSGQIIRFRSSDLRIVLG